MPEVSRVMKEICPMVEEVRDYVTIKQEGGQLHFGHEVSSAVSPYGLVH